MMQCHYSVGFVTPFLWEVTLTCHALNTWYSSLKLGCEKIISVQMLAFLFFSPWEQVPSHKYFPEVEVAMGSGWVVWISD